MAYDLTKVYTHSYHKPKYCRNSKYNKLLCRKISMKKCHYQDFWGGEYRTHNIYKYFDTLVGKNYQEAESEFAAKIKGCNKLTMQKMWRQWDSIFNSGHYSRYGYNINSKGIITYTKYEKTQWLNQYSKYNNENIVKLPKKLREPKQILHERIFLGKLWVKIDGFDEPILLPVYHKDDLCLYNSHNDFAISKHKVYLCEIIEIRPTHFYYKEEFKYTREIKDYETGEPSYETYYLYEQVGIERLKSCVYRKDLEDYLICEKK